MLKLIAAAIFFLEGLKVIASTPDVTWWLIALGILAVSLLWDWFPVATGGRWHRD